MLLSNPLPKKQAQVHVTPELEKNMFSITSHFISRTVLTSLVSDHQSGHILKVAQRAFATYYSFFYSILF